MKKKKKIAPKHQQKKLSGNLILGIGIGILALSLVLSIIAEQHRHNLIGNAQTSAPSYGSIGDCQTGNICPTTGASPTGTTNGAPSPITTSPSSTASPSSSVQPCHGIKESAENAHRRSLRNGDKGFGQMMLEFFKLFLQFILQLFGSGNVIPVTSTSPQPSVQPSGTPCPSPSQPSTAPSPQPATSPATTVSTAPAQPATSSGTTTYTPAVSNDCGNAGYQKYIAKTSSKMNFGDPSCTFTKDKLYTLLKQSDAAHADNWFLTIVSAESGYDPNAYAPPSTGTPDSGGAWGLYQMGSSTPLEQAPPAPGKNGIYDRGDVNWEIQTDNAIKYNTTVLKCSFKYWAAAKGFWGQFSC